MDENDEPAKQANNPLHGMTLEKILVFLVDRYGWEGLNRRIRVNCFFSHPSVKSSLKFLRKENWARIQVERLYLDTIAGTDAENRDFHE